MRMITMLSPEGLVVGRIMKAAVEPVGEPWLWTLVFGHHEDRWPTHAALVKRRPEV